jgi:hypothetical protein
LRSIEVRKLFRCPSAGRVKRCKHSAAAPFFYKVIELKR